MAISTLAYKITADTRQFNTEIAATRKELNLAKAVMRETEDPAKKLKNALTALEGIYAKKLISPAEYAKAQQKVKDELLGTSEATTTLQRNLGPLGKAFDALGVNVGNFINPLTAGLATLGGVMLLARKIGQSMQDIDRLAERAKSTGIDINELRAFEFAGERAGIEPEGVNRALQEMQKFVAKAGSATDEGKTARRVLGGLGLGAEQVAGKDVAGQFTALADAISRLGTQGERLVASQEVFGRQGREFIRILELGAAGLAENRAQVRAFLGDIDATKIDRLQDDIAAAKLAREGFFAGAAQEIAGFTAGPARALAESRLGISGGDVGKLWARGTLPGLLRTGQQLATDRESLEPFFQRLEKALGLVADNTKKIETNTRNPVEVTERGL